MAAHLHLCWGLEYWELYPHSHIRLRDLLVKHGDGSPLTKYELRHRSSQNTKDLYQNPLRTAIRDVDKIVWSYELKPEEAVFTDTLLISTTQSGAVPKVCLCSSEHFREVRATCGIPRNVLRPAGTFQEELNCFCYANSLHRIAGVSFEGQLCQPADRMSDTLTSKLTRQQSS